VADIQFPITVTEVDFQTEPPISTKGFLTTSKPGVTVAVRSCKKEHGDKTRLGILIGFVPIHAGVRFEAEDGKKDVGRLVFVNTGSNPAIFIPELNEVVLGCESWWGEIKSEKELKEITNEDINNLWYVRAMKEISARQAKEN